MVSFQMRTGNRTWPLRSRIVLVRSFDRALRLVSCELCCIGISLNLIGLQWLALVCIELFPMQLNAITSALYFSLINAVIPALTQPK
jgi:hypothetical protein